MTKTIENKSDNLNLDSNMSSRCISVSFLVLLVGIAAYVAAKTLNPDTDSYWLIETGRWIVENKSVPKINPWTYEENLSIIIQSPLCAIFNYLWYLSSGLSRMWQLAIIENFALILSTMYLSYQFAKNKTSMFLSAIVVEVLFMTCGLITTRPYQLTTASMMVLVANLERAKQKDSMLFAAFAVAFATIFQANYQMATLVMIACFISCYSFGNAVDRLRTKQKIRNSHMIAWLLIYIEWGILSCFNPYGIDGALYLIKSSDAMSMLSDKIYEMMPPTTMSIPFFISFLSILLFLFLKKKLQAPIGFLVIGTSFATFLASRNFWMSIIAFVVAYTLFINREKENKNSSFRWEKLKTRIAEELPMNFFRIKSILLRPSKKERISPRIQKVMCSSLLIVACILSTLFCLLSFTAGKSSVKDAEAMLTYIQSIPEDSKIYTTFNTGGLVELAGRKIHVDARPELYSKSITKSSVDLLNDWMDVEWHNPSKIPEYVKNHDWDYYFVASKTPIYFYFLYSENIAELKLENQAGAIFKIVSK